MVVNKERVWVKVETNWCLITGVSTVCVGSNRSMGGHSDHFLPLGLQCCYIVSKVFDCWAKIGSKT